MNHQHGPNCGCKEYLIQATENLIDLRQCIDFDSLYCLNELLKDQIKKVFKTEDQKQDKQLYVQSDSDAELLIVIPFVSNIKLKTICISSKSRENFAQNMKIYINQENVDFSLVEDQQAVQEFDMVHNIEANIEYSVKPMKFTNVYQLILHLSAEDFDSIQISYIGIKGIDTKNKSQVVHAQYEAKPMLKDHKAKEDFGNAHFIG